LIATDPVGIVCQFDSKVNFFNAGYFDTICELKDGVLLILSVLGVIPSEIGIIQS